MQQFPISNFQFPVSLLPTPTVSHGSCSRWDGMAYDTEMPTLRVHRLSVIQSAAKPSHAIRGLGVGGWWLGGSGRWNSISVIFGRSHRTFHPRLRSFGNTCSLTALRDRFAHASGNSEPPLCLSYPSPRFRQFIQLCFLRDKPNGGKCVPTRFRSDLRSREGSQFLGAYVCTGTLARKLSDRTALLSREAGNRSPGSVSDSPIEYHSLPGNCHR